MDVHLSAETEAKLRRVAAESGEDTQHYLQQFVDRYIDHDIWLRDKVSKGLAQLDKGEYLTHEEVGRRIQQLFES